MNAGRREAAAEVTIGVGVSTRGRYDTGLHD
jgi:hypothetical protein